MLANAHEVRRFTTAGVLAIAVAVAGGCGGDDDGEKAQPPGGGAPTPAPTGGGKTLQLKADASGQLRFDKKTLQAEAGKVTLVMDNPAAVPHNVAIEGGGVDEEGAVVQKDVDGPVQRTRSEVPRGSSDSARRLRWRGAVADLLV